MRLHGRVLSVAGSDSGGGAGVQADIKTLTACGAYALTAITALTVQDTRRVHAVHTLPPDFVAAQIRAALEDPGADAVKTGMLANEAIIAAVAAALRGRGLMLVVDPVMVATSGDALLDPPAIAALRTLFPLATLITPNAPEAALLTGRTIANLADMRAAAQSLRAQGANAVLLKGGHLAGEEVTDLLLTAAGETLLRQKRIATRHTHGTGCTLSAAIAAGLAQGQALPQAVERARLFVQRAIAEAPGFGAGHGPLNHAAGLTQQA